MNRYCTCGKHIISLACTYTRHYVCIVKLAQIKIFPGSIYVFDGMGVVILWYLLVIVV